MDYLSNEPRAVAVISAPEILFPIRPLRASVHHRAHPVRFILHPCDVCKLIQRLTDTTRAYYCRVSMESCRLSIELCETIMDALPDAPDPYLQWETGPKGQRTLCACALTCRAWRVRAQHLLLTFPRLLDGPHLSLFTVAIRNVPKPPTITLVLKDKVDLKLAAQLFIQPFPHLQHWSCAYVSFDSGLPLRLLRIRLPFFANINVLEMRYCRFKSARAMLHVVWACPNLSSLNISCVSLESMGPSTVGNITVELPATCEHLRACRKLTKLILDHSTLTVSEAI